MMLCRSLQPRSNQDSPSKRPERLPAINYSLLKDGPLRKKFRELGIPDYGNRALLQRRHTEWINLWNANCDAKYPKTKRELLSELDIWERTQGGSAAPAVFGSNPNTVMRKDFDAAKWSESHDNDFKRLIANARKRSDAQVRSTIPGASAAESNVSEQTTAPIAPYVPIATTAPIAPTLPSLSTTRAAPMFSTPPSAMTVPSTPNLPTFSSASNYPPASTFPTASTLPSASALPTISTGLTAPDPTAPASKPSENGVPYMTGPNPGVFHEEHRPV